MSTNGTYEFGAGGTYNVLPPFDSEPKSAENVSSTQEFVPIPGRALYHSDLLLIEGNGEIHLSQAEYDTMVLSDSPHLNGVPTADTAAVDTNTTQLATTAFVAGQASSDNPLMDGVAASGSSLRYSRKDHVHPSDTTKAPLVSPTFTGTVTVPNSSFSYAKLQNVSATDKLLGRVSAGAGVIEEISCTAAGRALLDDATATDQRTTIGLGNVTNESKATMFANAALTGNPTAPTQAANDSSTKIANTQFVSEAAENVKKRMGLYADTPNLGMTVIRNPQMDNTRPTFGKKIYKPLSSGAFTADMIGMRFKCTNAGGGSGDFRAGTSLLLKHHRTATPWIEDIVQDAPIALGILISGKNYKIIKTELNHFGVGKVVGDTFTSVGTEQCNANNVVSLMSFNLILNDYYTIVAAGTPTAWDSTVLTPVDGIEKDKWYIVQGDTVTYNSIVYPASTYDAYAATYADGQNAVPSIFKGVNGVTTYTGNGFVYELDYMVCTISTGDGTTSGTITLNWVPNIYSLFNPTVGEEWALHAVTYSGVTRDKTIKITGGDYDSKTLTFEVSDLGVNPLDNGYKTFIATDFEGRMVALYNPFESTFVVDWNTPVLPTGSRPSFASKYVIAQGLFKRKTDNNYCGLFYGIQNTSIEPYKTFGRIGYFTTSDFATTTINSKPIIDGKLTDTYLSSGTLTIGYKYKIIATQTDHFGEGLVVGDFFTATDATTCDASNIVRLVDPTWRYSGTISSVTYVGQASDGKYIWEGVIYYANDVATGRWGRKVEFLQFDETFSDEHLKSIEVDLRTYFGDANEDNLNMVMYPYYSFYNGVHRIAMLGYTSDLSVYPAYTYEYLSSNGKYGPYTTRNVIHKRDAVNDAYPASRDIELFNYFIYNMKLYALACGTSISPYCGFDGGKREVLLYRYNDTTGTWVLDSRSPILINPIYATATLWGCDDYAQYHVSALALCIEEGVMHLLVTANVTSNTYQVFYGTLDMKTLGPT